ncbi:unnamed protein product [Brassicogethes aeneus]|uniref:HIT-type domain-containing protein n=1 Tax=Brassicogethes aeneus TaxID=1431903 RepID=A0A9P0AV38_BRAAE|nr:unnamed protein product [Brassicogethes aeneus]
MAAARIVELDDSNTCKICDNALAKYSCPKCNILYCSVSCYQNQTHLQCSEDFYKDSLLGDLNLNKNDPESRKKMMEILERVHQSNKIASEDDFFDFEGLDDLDKLDSDDDEDFDDITARLQGVNLDDAETVWEKLTEDEKQEFVAFLRSEDVTKLIPPWEPWWLHSSKKMVEEINDVKIIELEEKCPKIINIKDFTSITAKTPADCVKYNLYNILSAYVFTVRYFNGEHFNFAKEAISCWSYLSLCVNTKENFQDFDTAVKSVEQQCLTSDWIVTDEENINIMKEDVKNIFEGPNLTTPGFYVLSALSDLYNLIEAAINPKDNTKETEFSKKFPNDHFPNVKIESNEKMGVYLKKIEYFLSYSRDILYK